MYFLNERVFPSIPNLDVEKEYTCNNCHKEFDHDHLDVMSKTIYRERGDDEVAEAIDDVAVCPYCLSADIEEREEYYDEEEGEEK